MDSSDYYIAEIDYKNIVKSCGANIGQKILDELDKKSKGKSYHSAFDLESIEPCKPIAVKYKYSAVPLDVDKLKKVETATENYITWTTFDCTTVKVKIDSTTDPKKPMVKYILEQEIKY
jgi:hypothetical protein